MHKIYNYTHLTPENTMDSLETIYLLSNIDNHFTFKEIAIFYNQHPNLDPILYNGQPTLSIFQIFLFNKKIAEFLGLENFNQSDVFALILQPLSKIDIFSFINNNAQQITNYLNTQGIFNETTLACAIIISKNKELKIPKYKEVSLNNLIKYICEPCLIRFSLRNEEFRKQLFLEFKNQRNIFGILMTVKNEFIDFNYFKSMDIYYLFLEKKNIVEEDVKEVIKFENNLKVEDKNTKLEISGDYLPIKGFLINKKYNKIQIYSQLLELKSKTKEDCLKLIVNLKKDFGILTDKKYLQLFQTNIYFTKKYLRNYILENIRTKNQLIYFECYKALLLKNKPPIIEYFDFLLENEKSELLNLYLMFYKADQVFKLCLAVGNEELIGIFSEPLNNLVYLSKFSDKITRSIDLKEDQIELTDRNIVIQCKYKEGFSFEEENLIIKINEWLSLLNSQKLTILIKNAINLDFLISSFNFSQLDEQNLKLFVYKCTNKLNLIEKLLNLNIYFDFSDLITSYDPSYILPLLLKLITHKCTLKIAKKVINFINECVLTDDFFEEVNLYLIKDICDKVVCIEDKFLEKIRMEIASKLQRYASSFERRIKIRKIN